MTPCSSCSRSSSSPCSSGSFPTRRFPGALRSSARSLATASLPDRFEHTEEWYSFASNPRARGARVLIAVDESTYTRSLGWLSPFMSNRLTMGDHPIVWSHCPGEGRALFSALGHQAASYDMPEHRLLLEEAVAWGAGLHGRACDDTLGPDPG